jgi:hypothetical protein
MTVRPGPVRAVKVESNSSHQRSDEPDNLAGGGIMIHDSQVNAYKCLPVRWSRIRHSRADGHGHLVRSRQTRKPAVTARRPGDSDHDTLKISLRHPYPAAPPGPAQREPDPRPTGNRPAGPGRGGGGGGEAAALVEGARGDSEAPAPLAALEDPPPPQPPSQGGGAPDSAAAPAR